VTGPDPRVAIGPELAPGAAVPVLEALDRLRPVVRVEPSASEPIALAAASLFSLLVRVHAHTVLEGDAALGPNPWGAQELSELPELLAGCRPPAVGAPARDMVIGVGPAVASADLWIGGGDWTARVGRAPQPVAGRTGLGLQAGVIYAAAEVLKVALGDHMMHVRADDEFVWNLWDYRNQPAPEIELASGRLDVVFFGSGSVGSSAVGLLSTRADLVGRAVVVDPDTFDSQRNPYRYPASTGTEMGPKARWTAGLLSASGWTADEWVGDAGSWTRAQPNPGLSAIAVSSVDTVSGRLQVADALAATTLSVGVAGMALHIQREHCFDEHACPYCEFVTAATPLSQAQAYAEMTGLTVERILELHLGDEVLTQEDLGRVVVAGKLHAERVDELVERRPSDLVQRIYAQALVSGVGQGNTETVTAVSTPFVSWMGGLLVVAELSKAAMGSQMVDRRVDLDLSGVPLGAVSGRRRDQSGQCTCHLPHRHRWATRLYGRDR
jgi:hypothetical protein